MDKKGQGAYNAAILVGLIAGLIILYIIFLPSVEKEALFDDENNPQFSSGSKDVQVLLREFPGLLEKAGSLEDEKDLPNVYLFETTNSKELDNINPFVISNGLFGDKTKQVRFTLDDPENTDNVVISFLAKQHEGALTIKLNDETIYENPIDSETVSPIKLDKNLLSRTNTLDFSVSSPGFKFWSKNAYALDNIRIIGDISDLSRQQSQNVFHLTQPEFDNIDKATLRFVPYCSAASDVGVLDISINGRNIFSAIPVCDDPYRQIIPANILEEGNNNVVFKTRKGSYSVEQVEISFEFKEAKTKTYFFRINESIFDDLQRGKKDTFLELEFVNDDETKEARIDLNDIYFQIDQDDPSYRRRITNDTIEGNNYVRIIPESDLPIVELRVKLEKK